MALAIDAEARATARYLPISASKVRPVLALIRGRSVEDAERELQLCQRSAADAVFKVLESAIANAEHTREIPPEELYVAACFADEGPTRRWGRPRARGRYGRIKKRTSHLTIALGRYSQDELERIRARQEARGAGSAEQRRRRAERVRASRGAVAAPGEIEVDAAGEIAADEIAASEIAAGEIAAGEIPADEIPADDATVRGEDGDTATPGDAASTDDDEKDA
jgi:large subunit ribosomal protein L22